MAQLASLSDRMVIPDRSSSMGVQLSLILPTYNEARNIEKVVSILCELLTRIIPDGYEVIVVDDDSPDRTWEIAERLSETYPQLRVVRRQNERGLATAVIRGWQCASGDVLGVIDADLQHPPEIVTALWAEICRGADLAAGSRHVEGGGLGNWGIVRRMLSRSAQLLGLTILPDVLGRLSDPMSGCFLVRRSAIASTELKPIGYKILLEVVGRGRIGRISEVGYVFREREQGESKVSWRLYLDYLRHLFRLRMGTLPAREFLQFAIVGTTGVAVDMGLLFFLSDPSMLARSLGISKFIAGEASIFNNFCWNDVWTFRKAASGQRSWSRRAARFLKFNAVCGAGLVLAVVLLTVQFRYLGVNRYVANAISIGIVTLWNFTLSKKFSWSAPKIRHTTSRTTLAESLRLAQPEIELDRAA
jgi:dolichol-phosphate mannosyltransferase